MRLVISRFAAASLDPRPLTGKAPRLDPAGNTNGDAPVASTFRQRRWLWPCLLALALVLLNAFKPIHIDDSYYYRYAGQIADHPLDPYGFGHIFMNRYVPANHSLAPPLLLYWWALAIRLFGTQPFLWKLWLLPFALALTLSLDGLFKRFAPRVALPLVAMITLSPAVLPGMNLMLDVPALALSLLAITAFLLAGERNSPGLALLAGAIAGMAMLTKYTGLLAPAAIVVAAVIFRHWRLGVAAVCIALCLFSIWEMAVAWRYGESHFLYHLTHADPSAVPRASLVPALFIITGGVAPALIPLGLAAFFAPRWSLAAALAITLVFSAVALTRSSSLQLSLNPSLLPPALTGQDIVFGVLGLIAWCLIAATVLRLICRSGQSLRLGNRNTIFLVAWLGVEVAGYFFLSPFPAVRRLLGTSVVATLLIGRLIAELDEHRLWLVRGIALGGVVLGLGFYGIDLVEALAEKSGVAAAVRRIRGEQPDAVIWYVGGWGFQFYAEQAHMKPVVPSPSKSLDAHESSPRYRRESSKLHQGDWLIVPFPMPKQYFEVQPTEVEVVDRILIQDRIPLQTVPCYYSGYAPLKHLGGPRLVINIARIKADFVPVAMYQ